MCVHIRTITGIQQDIGRGVSILHPLPPSPQDITASLQAGVLAEARAPAGGLRYFRCFTCGKEDIVDIASHIQQLSHRNFLAWDVIKLEHPKPALLHLLPEDVRLAKLGGHVEAVSKTFSSFQCKVCQGKKPFSGLMPLLQHLSGKEHKKALDRAKWSTQATRSQPAAQPAPIPSTSAFSPSSPQAVPVAEPSSSVLAPPAHRVGMPLRLSERRKPYLTLLAGEI